MIQLVVRDAIQNISVLVPRGMNVSNQFRHVIDIRHQSILWIDLENVITIPNIGKNISIDKRQLVQLVDGSSVLVVDVDSTLLFHCVDVPKEKTVTAIRHYQVGVIIGDSPTLTGFGSEEELSLEVELLVEDESFMLAPCKHVDRVIYVRYSFA